MQKCANAPAAPRAPLRRPRHRDSGDSAPLQPFGRVWKPNLGNHTPPPSHPSLGNCFRGTSAAQSPSMSLEERGGQAGGAASRPTAASALTRLFRAAGPTRPGARAACGMRRAPSRLRALPVPPRHVLPVPTAGRPSYSGFRVRVCHAGDAWREAGGAPARLPHVEREGFASRPGESLH